MVSLINFKTFDVDLNESQTISSSSGNVGRQTDTASSQRPQDKIAQSKQDRQANVKPDNSSHANGTAPQEEQQPKQQQLWHRQDMSAQEQYEAAGIKTSSRFSSTDAVVVVSDGGPNQDANLGDCCTGATAGYGYYCSRDEQHLATMDASKQQLVDGKPVASGQNYQLSISSSCSSSASSSSSSSASSSRHIAPPSSNKDVCSKNVAAAAASFTVTWRKLKFCIEPKWHERIASGSAALIGLASRANSTSSSPPLSSSSSSQSSTLQATKTTEPAPAATDCAQQTPAPTTTKPRIVLDQLDGSFKSGELTAILGPSGAGKTTLLDCLTGHRKSGLSGSVRFSIVPSTTTTTASSSSLCNPELGTPCGDCAAASAERQLASFAHRAHCAPKCEPQTRQKNLILATQQTGPGSCLSKQQQLQPHDHHRNSQTTTAAAAAEKLGCRLRKSPTPTTRLAATASSDMPMNGDNLKVSIIPQNDHLIGHLTVYETLNYASKMKNCFEGQFDHKLNVRRVAQQLGLMSCLGTRINKLSGGQYKRVSIAQELLSSPDVLILDEPTSGLDAMTCYQTVQVLKKLTEDCRASGEKSIAVILTIHQPNSDVFQQFNHVYVVAQGGKCIYEGPPASIESVINRVGICLPNSYYNPATMIVEIAAGKFGQEAISKLNAIQRKQYSESVPLVDEQNSTGDSAVDCPSSNYEDDDDDDNSSSGNNNKLTDASMKGGAGKINAGFEIDSELDADTNNNNNNNNNRQDHNKTEDNCCVPLEKQDRRRKRRRTRRRASEMATSGGADNNSGGQMLKVPAADSRSMTPSAVKILINGSDGGLCKGKGKGYGGGYGDGDSGDGNASDAGAGGGGGGGGHGGGRAEKRLKLNSLKADQKFPFWRHTYLHFHRSWLSIVRDPMLCSMQLALHIIVPVMVSLVYGTYVGKPNACPRAGPIDIMAYALEPTDTALQLQEDLRTTLENIGYIFFKLYGIIFAAMTVTVLTFPLDMHVLVKEFRNGWYGLSSYFLGRTLADIPFQLTLPLLAMSLSYYATGQPSSYLQWRFFSITAILILSSLIAQSQGLLFGAILMDKMKAAVFVAPAATTPIILFAGFLVRTQSIPSYLRPLSNLSYLRYAIEACLISRYGFNQCECDPAIFNQTVRELPPIARSMLDYWLSSYRPISDVTNGTLDMDMDNNSTAVAGPSALDAAAATNESMVANKPDLFTKLIDSLTRANSFGRNITSCEQVVPYPMIDYDLKDEQLFSCFAILLAMLIFTRLLTFFIVCYKVKRKV